MNGLHRAVTHKTSSIFAALLASVLASTAVAQARPDHTVEDEGAQVFASVRVEARHTGETRFHLVRDGAVLQNGDEIQIELTALERHYAYIFYRGSEGDWLLVFPNPAGSKDPGAANPLLPGEVFSIPGRNSRLVVSGPPGLEELVVYTLQEPDHSTLDNLVDRLRRGEHPRIELAGIPPSQTGVAAGSPPQIVPDSGSTDDSGRLDQDRSGGSTAAEGVAVRLPPNFAVRYLFRHAEPSPGKTLP